MTIAQTDYEKKFGMTIDELRMTLLDMTNDERWRFMKAHKISGGVINLHPEAYPKKPKGWKDDGEQYSLEDFL